MVKGKIGTSLALACSALLALGGCTQTSGGAPGPTGRTPTTGSAEPSATDSANTAPAITNPLDVSKFMADPCLSITPAQATELTISPQGKQDNLELSDSCNWKYGPNLESDVAVLYIIPDAKNGLQNLYNQKATGGYDKGYFEPTTINGYPAIYEDGSDNRQNGECSLSVGINEQVFFTILNDGPRNTELCRGAAKAASAVVDTIKKG